MIRWALIRGLAPTANVTGSLRDPKRLGSEPRRQGRLWDTMAVLKYCNRNSLCRTRRQNFRWQRRTLGAPTPHPGPPR